MRRCNGLRSKDLSRNPECNRPRPSRSLNSRNPRRSRVLMKSQAGDRTNGFLHRDLETLDRASSLEAHLQGAHRFCLPVRYSNKSGSAGGRVK
jgi:hypothetical protein